MYKNDLTQDCVKKLFLYDSKSGVLTNRVRRGGRSKAGSTVGSIDAYGYLTASINYSVYKVHRIIWLYVYGEFPPDEIDHINKIRDDNRITNLRAVNHQENSTNPSIGTTNTSGCVGVGWDKQKQRWKVRIYSNGKMYRFGSYVHKKDAIAARMAVG